MDIVEFIGQYVQLKRAGKNFKARCPFHQEHSPSFVISPERQIWHCFGACNEGGDVISFLMKWENISFPEALKELAHQTGVPLDTESFNDSTWTKKERLYEINVLAQRFYHYVLQETHQGTLGREYLHDRGVNEDIIKTFQIGMAVNSWDSLLRYLQKKKITEQEMSDAGLVIQGKNGRFYDRFRNRLMFPLADPRGNIIGFAGRQLGSQTEQPPGGKYINTPETILYRKRESLYGIHLAKDHIKKARNAILVEGEFDVISPFQRGIRNIVAIKGSAVTREQLQVLKRYTNRISLALDADVAGQEAVLRGIREAEKLDIEVQVIIIEGGKDPDEVARHDIGTLKQLITHATSLYDYVISSAIQRHGTDSAYKKKNITDEVVPHLVQIQNPIIQAHYVKHLAHELELSEESVKESMRAYKRKMRLDYHHATSSSGSAQSSLQKAGAHDQTLKQKYGLSMLLQSTCIAEACDIAQSILMAADFSVPAYGKIFTALLTYVQNDRPDEISINDFISSLPKELHPVADELYLVIPDLPPLSKKKFLQEFKKLVYRIKFDSLGRHIQTIDEADENDEEKDKIKVHLIQKRKELEKNMQRL